jgi:hypothetical protein
MVEYRLILIIGSLIEYTEIQDERIEELEKRLEGK